MYQAPQLMLSTWAVVLVRREMDHLDGEKGSLVANPRRLAQAMNRHRYGNRDRDGFSRAENHEKEML